MIPWIEKYRLIKWKNEDLKISRYNQPKKNCKNSKWMSNLTSNFQVCNSRSPRPRFDSAFQSTNFVRWFFEILLPRVSSLAVQCAVIRITVEYAFEWNMQREPRHRTNKSVRTGFARDRIHAYYAFVEFLPSMLFTVVTYARPWLYFIIVFNQCKLFREMKATSVLARRFANSTPRKFSEPSRDWKMLPGPRDVFCFA